MSYLTGNAASAIMNQSGLLGRITAPSFVLPDTQKVIWTGYERNVVRVHLICPAEVRTWGRVLVNTVTIGHYFVRCQVHFISIVFTSADVLICSPDVVMSTNTSFTALQIYSYMLRSWAINTIF